MTTATKPQTSADPTPPQPAKLRIMRVEDYPQVQKLEAAHSLLTLSPDVWRQVWLDNPLLARLGDSWPMGWVLENSSGDIVGSLANLPTAYTYRGRTLIAAVGRAWVVAPKYRGLALWLMDEYFNQENVDLFLCNTVNTLAAAAFASLNSPRFPLGDWNSAAYWITNFGGFAATALRIKHMPLPVLLAPPAAAVLKLYDSFRGTKWPAPATSVQIAEVAGFDERFDAFWKELVAQNPEKMLCVRDRSTLAWHFAGPLRSGDAWILTATGNGLIRAYAIFKRQDHPPTGLRRMRLVDYQSLDRDADLLSPLLGCALRRCVAERIHTLEHVGCNLPKMKTFDALAPYRRRLGSWPCYYSAPDPALADELRNPQVWDPSSYDGDASL